MLSAFTARPIVELKQRDKSKVESILAYGDRLLVGLNTGTLRIYRVNELHDELPANNENVETSNDVKPKQRPVDLLREEEKFSRRAVQQLAIIKEANILVSLSDSYVSIHDLQTYALQERLEKTRGATSFAVTSNIVKDPTTGIPSIVSRLAVAVKRKIIFWSWQDMELSSEVPEIILLATVKSITWASGTKIVAGMDPGFVLVDVESQDVLDIIRPGSLGDAGGQAGARFGAVSSSGMSYMGMGGWVPKPMATKLSDGQLLLAKDVNSLFIDESGNALDKRQIPWAMAPEAIGYSYPYMLALQPPSKGGLEVRNPDTLSLLQTVSLPNATILHVPQPNISLAHAGKGFLVGSDRCIWRMGALEYESQIDELIANARYDEAISLLNMLEDTLLKDKEGRIREAKMLKAQTLFDLRKYQDALDLFSEASTSPERVIALYPKSIAGDLSSIESVKDAESDVDHEEPNGGANITNKAAPNTPASSLGRSLFGKVKTEQKKVDSDTSSILSLKIGDSAASVSDRGKHTETVQDKPLEGKDLILAAHALSQFLVQTRSQLQRYINIDGTLKQPIPTPGDGQIEEVKPPFHHLIILPSSNATNIDWQEKLHEVAVIVDTTLFRAYMYARPALAGPLFRLDNFCDPVVVRDKLYESGRYNDLIDFLHGKKLHREALELLAKFGKNEADEEVSSILRGPQRTIGYLQQLPPEMIDLILEFAEWPLRTDPDAGMEIFLADTENAETLPRKKVLQFLEKINSDLAVRYLEHIVNELNDQTPDYHQRLIDLYLERLKIKADEKEALVFKSEEDRKNWRERLQEFLNKSGQYNRAQTLRQLSADDPDFHESRAIVLSNMGQYRQALQIYVFQIKDYQKAEDYCNQIYISKTAGSSATSTHQAPPSDPDDSEPSIYHILLSLYLNPPPPNKANWSPALDLLSKHGARLPALSTLELVPPSLPVKDLESYFRGRIRSANSILNEERIASRLRAVEKGEVEGALLLGDGTTGNGGKNRRVIIGEDRHCTVCHKRFGGSAIKVLPDNSVVHWGCFNRGAGQGAEGPRRRGW
ncbi:vacuolar assembly/sorting proteins VPS39/VAM6/VPS3 [Patellaria atrata CBS 101060]|uniref:Vacuolar assembly/sorting proteins VPS39/VAM6/VPS3 n=1 Tax=Patellaria atrata CBS 101060 TaxID=1346257 RepID=A0A9P4VTL2_9PEZI|nr:vacuolar assembly/sorting proteins VPS39/VAM6/VPS3 [Patellaria atrata CBS 101060]